MSDRRADTPSLASRHLLGIEGLQRSEVEAILALARQYKQGLKDGIQRTPLAGKFVALLFFEDSTRTRSSFEIAAKSLGAKVLNWSPTGSSLSKGETLLDTVKNIDASRRNPTMRPTSQKAKNGTKARIRISARAVSSYRPIASIFAIAVAIPSLWIHASTSRSAMQKTKTSTPMKRMRNCMGILSNPLKINPILLSVRDLPPRYRATCD